MKVNRGDVVLLDHPFSAGGGSKVRPAVVVQADTRNQRITNTIMVMVTSNTSRIATDSTQVLIEVNTPDGSLMPFVCV